MEALRRDSIRSVFCYAYRPCHSQDGGFAVNVYTDDVLTFATFDPYRQPLQELVFHLRKGSAQRVLALIERADPWLRTFPLRMCCKPQPDAVSLIGVDGYPLFQMEDFTSLMTCEFRSIRGHNARLMFNLLEDVAAVLSKEGCNLTLTGFGWHNEYIRPEPPETGADAAGATG